MSKTEVAHPGNKNSKRVATGFGDDVKVRRHRLGPREMMGWRRLSLWWRQRLVAARGRL